MQLVWLQVSVLAYGAFVDIGAVTDGLVHVSQMTVRINVMSLLQHTIKRPQTTPCNAV